MNELELETQLGNTPFMQGAKQWVSNKYNAFQQGINDFNKAESDKLYEAFRALPANQYYARSDYDNQEQWARDFAGNMMGSIHPKWRTQRVTAADINPESMKIPNDSYIYSDEYKALEDARRKALEDMRAAKANPNRTVPKSEWSELDKWIYDNLGIEPFSDEMFAAEKIAEKRYNEADEALENALRRISKIQSADHPKDVYYDWQGNSDTFDIAKHSRDIDDYLKNGQGRLVSMSPEEYLRRCGLDIFQNSTYENQARTMLADSEKVANYANRMIDGSKAPVPHLTYVPNPDYFNEPVIFGRAQDGRHRAAAAMILGEDKIPVWVIE